MAVKARRQAKASRCIRRLRITGRSALPTIAHGRSARVLVGEFIAAASASSRIPCISTARRREEKARLKRQRKND
jgi:hypothetical protein